MIEIYLIHPINKDSIGDGDDIIYTDHTDFVMSGVWYEFEEFGKVVRCFIPFTNIKFYRERTNLTPYKE